MKIDSPKAILHELERFRQMGSVLFVAAHPDDENTELLGYLARGRNLRSAYLSVTRGDGGQNVLGADLGEKLGVARTQELLAARQIDGAKQFFTRAIDFGFSKNYQETLNVWDKNQVLSDVVRVIREFRPDVVITRFSPSPGGTHGHHTASTILALEAFKLAGDPKAFPGQKLEPWQPKRIFWNVSTWQKDKIANANVLKIKTSGNDPVSGGSFHSIASASRAMHKTQGFDTYKLPGGDGEERFDSFQLLDGAPVTNDIMDGVDTTWDRIPGGAEIGKLAADVITKFDTKDPAASVPLLLNLRSKLNEIYPKAPIAGDSAQETKSVKWAEKVPGDKSDEHRFHLSQLTDVGHYGKKNFREPQEDVIVEEKREQLDRILQACLGLKTATTIPTAEVVPGEPMKLHFSASFHSKTPGNIPIRWSAVRFPKLKKEVRRGIELKLNEISSLEEIETLPKTTPLTQPYWLRTEGTPGMFHVDEPELIGTAENAPAFPVENIFEIDGQKLIVPDEPLQISSDSIGNQIRHRLDVIPPVSLRFISDVAVMTPGTSRSVEVEIKASRLNSSGTLSLEAPPGWKVEPAKQSFKLSTIGQVARSTFTVTAPKKSDTAKITASAEIAGVRYHNQLQEINYPHIPRQLLQPPAVVKTVSVELATRGKSVGYLSGAGDSLVENLGQMGYAVKILDDANLTAQQLEGLDAVVIGVRAFNVRANIGKAMPTLLAYVENGGTLIAQYNRPDKLKSEKIAPYDLKISGDRVTDEKAAITFLASDNAVLNTPNKITSADFDGWVQERGLYFPNQWDDHFTPILACNDAGEAPTKGALLVAKYGKGYYIYTGLSFFRQLPAGVPGAYRLFANMVSIGE